MCRRTTYTLRGSFTFLCPSNFYKYLKTVRLDNLRVISTDYKNNLFVRRQNGNFPIKDIFIFSSFGFAVGKFTNFPRFCLEVHSSNGPY